MKILMVCLGNICRSPLAHGILETKIAQLKLNWQVDSAGTGGYHNGEPPHHLSQEVAKQNGIDISKQRARQFLAADMDLFDKIIVMDAANYNDVKRIAANKWQPQKVELLLNYLYPNQNKQVPDPWYGGKQDFIQVFQMIDKACDAFIELNK